MKSILISIRPEWVAKILNGEKTIEIRRNAPKCDLPVEVYIYCTKGGDILYAPNGYNEHYWTQKHGPLKWDLRGKVLAKFVLRKIEEIKYHFGYYDMGGWTEQYIHEKSCLTCKQLDDYLQASEKHDETKPSPVYGYGWHISNLKIFDEPKPLAHFGKDRPPQSWEYIGRKPSIIGNPFWQTEGNIRFHEVSENEYCFGTICPITAIMEDGTSIYVDNSRNCYFIENGVLVINERKIGRVIRIIEEPLYRRER